MTRVAAVQSWPGVPVAPQLDRLGDRVEVGVVEDDDRRLATELEVQPLDLVGGDPCDVLAGVRVAGHRHHPDLGVADERVADDRAAAGDHVEHARRQDVGRDLGQDQRRQRGPDGRLEDDRVAGREGRADLPAGHHDRVVPRRDGRDHAHRFAADERGVAFHVLVRGLALEQARGAREEPQVVDHDRDLVDRGGDRLAGVLRLEATQLVGPCLDGIGELEERQAALLRRGLAPGLEGRLGGVRGAVDVLGARRLDPGDDLLVGRVLDVDRLARGGVDPLAVDELLVRLDAFRDVGHLGCLLGRWVRSRWEVSSSYARGESASRHAVGRRGWRASSDHGEHLGAPVEEAATGPGGTHPHQREDPGSALLTHS